MTFPLQQPPPAGQIPFGPVMGNWMVQAPHRIPGLPVPVIGFQVRTAGGFCHHVQPAEFWPQFLDAMQECLRQLTGGLILPPGVTMPSHTANGAGRPPADLPAEMTDQDRADIDRLNAEEDPPR